MNTSTNKQRESAEQWKHRAAQARDDGDDDMALAYDHCADELLAILDAEPATAVVSDTEVEAACAIYFGDEWPDVDDAELVRISMRAALEHFAASRAMGDARDAERYRWLRDVRTRIPGKRNIVTGYNDNDESFLLWNNELDAAIDAAIKGESRG